MDGEPESTRKLSKQCILLIAIGGMERFTFKGVSSNLVMYLTDVVGMSNSAAAKTVNWWIGVTWLLPLAVAPLTDSYFHHYSTILASSLLYAAGLLALTWAASKESAIETSALLWPLLIVSMGQAGYNPSLQAFAADQQGKVEPETDKKSLFFQWWYFGICSGSLLGVSVISYIQDTFSWRIGFAIPAMTMIFSIIIFSSSSKICHFKKSSQQVPLGQVVQAVRLNVSKIIGRNRIILDKPEIVELELQVRTICDEAQGDSDNDYNSSHAEKIKIVMRLMPIWGTLLMFAVIFQLPATFFTKQGTTMRRNIGREFKIPPAALQSAITLSVILLMPLYDKLLLPAVRTISPKGVSVHQRMGIGMLLSVIAMVVAATVETRRREWGGGMSIYYLLPQYILLGVSDIFTVVGMQEFFYSGVPARMRATGIALYSSVFGVGSFLGAGLIWFVEFFTDLGAKGPSWFADNMKDARLDKYYWLLALLGAFSLVIFALFSIFYPEDDDLRNVP